MISWIQRNFQHHFKVVFAVILIGTIVSFVISFGPSAGIGRGSDKVVVREFYGHKLDGPNPATADFNDAKISIELQAGGLGGISAEQIGSYALQRLAALHLADELHLPPATETEQVDAIKNLRLFFGSTGQFDPQRYAMFRESLKNTPGVSETDVLRIISDDARIAKIQGLLGGPGYVLPGDVRDQLVRSDTAWTIGTATIDYASFKPSIEPSGAQLEKFFQQNSFRYDLPPTVVVSTIDFPASAFVGSVAVTDAEVRAYYDANPARFPSPVAPKAAKKPVVSSAALDYAAVRPAVEAALKQERAKNLAIRAASDLAYSLYDDKVAAGAPLDAYLAARKLSLRPLAPFSHEAGPAELGGAPEVADAAFKLNADRYFSEAVPTPTGGAVVIWKETLPARTPFLADVRAKVAADYIENERRERFVELGRTLHNAIAERIKAGATFEKAARAAAAAAGVAVDAKTLPPFTLATRPKDLNETVGGALVHLDKGQLSDMALTADKGYLVYVIDRKSPRASQSDPRFAEVRSELAANSARAGAGGYLSQMVDQELKRSEPVVK